jgi:hypothetical protein
MSDFSIHMTRQMWTLFIPKTGRHFGMCQRSTVWRNFAGAKGFPVPITTNEAAQAGSSFSTRADSHASPVF